jgi:predicted MFS family arabinose efflux permease
VPGIEGGWGRAFRSRRGPTPEGYLPGVSAVDRPPAPEPSHARLGEGIERAIVLLLAAICGTAVASLYYAQPLLDTLARAFSVSTGTAGLIVTVGQIGYVLGLAFLVPLGDLLERRALIATTMVLAAVGLVVCALAPGFAVFAAGTALVGVTCVAAQIVVPMASSLARPHERGRVVGTVMSGLLIGILLARTFSGIIASLLGWRVVFWVGAALLVALALTLRRMLPSVPRTSELRYHQALRSIVALVVAEPVLRQRMALGALVFGCFSTLWTSLSFLLAAAPFHYSNAVIGLFGLAGVAGAGAATVAGRATDRGHGRAATTVTLVLLLLSWAILYLARHSAAGLLIGIAVLDLGVQGTHIGNQSAIYSLAAEARSRLTTAYMVAYFTGGAVLSAVTSSLYSSDGWGGVCVLGGATAALTLVVWVSTLRVGAVPAPADEA